MIVARGDDRRQGVPRRVEDARAWYSRELLVGVALDYAAALDGLSVDPESQMGRLKRAASTYRTAEAGA